MEYGTGGETRAETNATLLGLGLCAAGCALVVGCAARVVKKVALYVCRWAFAWCVLQLVASSVQATTPFTAVRGAVSPFFQSPAAVPQLATRAAARLSDGVAAFSRGVSALAEAAVEAAAETAAQGALEAWEDAEPRHFKAPKPPTEPPVPVPTSFSPKKHPQPLGPPLATHKAAPQPQPQPQPPAAAAAEAGAAEHLWAWRLTLADVYNAAACALGLRQDTFTYEECDDHSEAPPRPQSQG